MFLAVSMNVSPFDRLLVEAVKSTVSAPNRRAASEKLVRVRVEASKNRFAQVLPARTGIFCLQPAVASLNITAVSRIVRSSSADRLFEIQQMTPRPAGWHGANVDHVGTHETISYALRRTSGICLRHTGRAAAGVGSKGDRSEARLPCRARHTPRRLPSVIPALNYHANDWPAR